MILTAQIAHGLLLRWAAVIAWLFVMLAIPEMFPN
jgi:hypothetical protein